MGDIGQFLVGGGFVGVVVALLNFLLTRPKVRAEAAKIATDNTTAVIEQYRNLITDLNARLGRTEERLTNMETRNTELERLNDQLEVRNAELERMNAALTVENIRLRGIERMLTDHLEDLSDWVRRYWATHPHQGMEPPPLFEQ